MITAHFSFIRGEFVLNGVMLAWYLLTIPSVIFVAVDIWRTTPEATVMKWAFVILTLFAGPIGAFFYVLGCREPLKGTHEQFVAARWRQALGSTMHCAAGDGVGIIAGAAIGAALTLAFWPDFLLQYVLGFGFGWAFFQAFAMRDMAGGSYSRSLRMTFLPEFLSMNLLMAGMQLVSKLAMSKVAGADDPAQPTFWFIMSMALMVGFAFAYPMNWWLVANHMKHGMITVSPAVHTAAATAGHPRAMADITDEHSSASVPGSMDAQPHDMGGNDEEMGSAPTAASKAFATVFSLAVLGVSLAIAHSFAM